MTTHLADQTLSALIDDMLDAAELADAQAHLHACAECSRRVEELRSVASLLRQLPDLEPPRSFALGPRAVADPPNLVRLRRWYAASRVAAAALAAGFVFLLAGTLYGESRPMPLAAQPAESFSPATGGAGSRAVATVPSGTQQLSARDAARPGAAPAIAPAAAPPPTSAPAQAAAGAPAPAAARAAPAAVSNAAPDPDDQVAAATSVRPLPTPLPTPTTVVAPTAVPLAARLAPTPQPGDDAATLRWGAATLGLLAALALFAAVVLRHRLRQAAPRI